MTTPKPHWMFILSVVIGARGLECISHLLSAPTSASSCLQLPPHMCCSYTHMFPFGVFAQNTGSPGRGRAWPGLSAIHLLTE